MNTEQRHSERQENDCFYNTHPESRSVWVDLDYYKSQSNLETYTLMVIDMYKARPGLVLTIFTPANISHFLKYVPVPLNLDGMIDRRSDQS